MSKWTVSYYKTESGECPVEKFINSRNAKNQQKIFGFLEQLEIEGPYLPRPYADILRDGIHELRIKLSGDEIRVLYFFCYKKNIILTHAFVKHSNKVPDTEIERAIALKNEFLGRIKEEDLI